MQRFPTAGLLIRLRKQNVFDGSDGGFIFGHGHGGVPSRESGDVEHHQPAMTALSQRICRTLSTLPFFPTARHADYSIRNGRALLFMGSGFCPAAELVIAGAGD
ncbi:MULTISPECIES: hypothetical protein [Mesorhizobium]|uniref:hypothetical protein n=1 Tax=Mesorhizobium australicum TaxID=536018 RepID=UPI0033361988